MVILVINKTLHGRQQGVVIYKNHLAESAIKEASDENLRSIEIASCSRGRV